MLELSVVPVSTRPPHLCLKSELKPTVGLSKWFWCSDRVAAHCGRPRPKPPPGELVRTGWAHAVFHLPQCHPSPAPASCFTHHNAMLHLSQCCASFPLASLAIASPASYFTCFNIMLHLRQCCASYASTLCFTYHSAMLHLPQCHPSLSSMLCFTYYNVMVYLSQYGASLASISCFTYNNDILHLLKC